MTCDNLGWAEPDGPIRSKQAAHTHIQKQQQQKVLTNTTCIREVRVWIVPVAKVKPRGTWFHSHYFPSYFPHIWISDRMSNVNGLKRKKNKINAWKDRILQFCKISIVIIIVVALKHAVSIVSRTNSLRSPEFRHFSKLSWSLDWKLTGPFSKPPRPPPPKLSPTHSFLTV